MQSGRIVLSLPSQIQPMAQMQALQFMMIVDNQEDLPTDSMVVLEDDTTQKDATTPDQFFSLSTAAFYGLSSPQALRFTG